MGNTVGNAVGGDVGERVGNGDGINEGTAETLGASDGKHASGSKLEQPLCSKSLSVWLP